MVQDLPKWNDIAYKHKTDKSDRYWVEEENRDVPAHGYADKYQLRLADPMVLRTRSILEIGVLHGESLRFWKEVFPEAQIIGIDIDPSCLKWTEERISISIVDAGDHHKISSFAATAPKFDFIVDDGSHKEPDIEVALKALWPNLNLGGLYAIEDCAVRGYQYPAVWTGWHARIRDWVTANGGVMSAHPSQPHTYMFTGVGVYFIDKVI